MFLVFSKCYFFPSKNQVVTTLVIKFVVRHGHFFEFFLLKLFPFVTKGPTMVNGGRKQVIKKRMIKDFLNEFK